MPSNGLNQPLSYLIVIMHEMHDFYAFSVYIKLFMKCVHEMYEIYGLNFSCI